MSRQLAPVMWHGHRSKYLIALVAGSLSAVGFAPLGIWPLTLLAIAWLIHVTAAAGRGRQQWSLGWLFGLGHFGVGLNWVAGAFQYQVSLPGWAGWIAVPILAAYLALFPATAFVVAGKIAPARGYSRILLLAAGWILLEWLRGWLFTGFAWNPLGAIWIDVPPVALLARAIGATGLSGLTIIFAGLLARMIEARRSALAITAIGLTAAVPFLWRFETADASSRGPRVRVVQPHIGQSVKWRPELAGRNLQQQINLSGPAEAAGAPRMIFWPEAAVAGNIENDPALRQKLADMLGPRDLLLTGGTALLHDRQGNPAAATNSMFVIDANGRVVARYDKAHLVPFGEYVPSFAEWLGFDRFVEGELEFASGPGPRSLDLPTLPAVGVSICYEISFPGRVLGAGKRPAFIFNPSNDAWFGAWGPPQHLSQARLRAIEEGLPVIRSTPTGISAVIRKDGSVVAALPRNQAGFIETALPAAGEPTLYSRLGDALPLGLAAILGLVGVGYARRPRRRASSSSPHDTLERGATIVRSSS